LSQGQVTSGALTGAGIALRWGRLGGRDLHELGEQGANGGAAQALARLNLPLGVERTLQSKLISGCQEDATERNRHHVPFRVASGPCAVRVTERDRCCRLVDRCSLECQAGHAGRDMAEREIARVVRSSLLPRADSGTSGRRGGRSSRRDSVDGAGMHGRSDGVLSGLAEGSRIEVGHEVQRLVPCLRGGRATCTRAHWRPEGIAGLSRPSPAGWALTSGHRCDERLWEGLGLGTCSNPRDLVPLGCSETPSQGDTHVKESIVPQGTLGSEDSTLMRETSMPELAILA